MKRLELWRWRYFDPVPASTARRALCSNEADAAVQFSDGAVKVESSLEVREVPETDEEIAAASTGAFQRGGTNRRAGG